MAGDLRPALIGSAAVHAGVVLAGIIAWPHREEPPKPPPVPVMLVSAPPGSTRRRRIPTGPATPPVEPEPQLSLNPRPPAAPPPAPSPPVPQNRPPRARSRSSPPRSRASAASPADAGAAARSSGRAPAARAPTALAAPGPATPARRQPSPPTPAAEPGLDLRALRDRLQRSRGRPPRQRRRDRAPARLPTQEPPCWRGLVDAWNPNCGVPGGSINVRIRLRSRRGAA
jgi:hypothetical protein